MGNRTWYSVSGEASPVIGVAMHSGHQISDDIARLMAVTEETRLREEDPFTEQFIESIPFRIVVEQSRFGVDLNRVIEKAVYLKPEDAWGIRVWKTQPPDELVQALRQQHQEFYEHLGQILSEVQTQFGRFVVVSSHTYEQARGEPEKSPDIDVCTWLVEEPWQSLIDSFVCSLRAQSFRGRSLEVKQNTRFAPHNLEMWQATSFPNSCCFAVEIAKELFMTDNLLGVIPERLAALKELMQNAIQVILDDLGV